MDRSIRTNVLPCACNAPPLTDEKIGAYKALIEAQPRSEVRDAMETCLRCVQAWWELPESKEKATSWTSTSPDGTRKYVIDEVPLDQTLIDKLWDATPYMRDLTSMDALLDNMPIGALRDAFAHLLWHAKEISLDREPMTSDKLVKA